MTTLTSIAKGKRPPERSRRRWEIISYRKRYQCEKLDWAQERYYCSAFVIESWNLRVPKDMGLVTINYEFYEIFIFKNLF